MTKPKAIQLVDLATKYLRSRLQIICKCLYFNHLNKKAVNLNKLMEVVDFKDVAQVIFLNLKNSYLSNTSPTLLN